MHERIKKLKEKNEKIYLILILTGKEFFCKKFKWLRRWALNYFITLIIWGREGEKRSSPQEVIDFPPEVSDFI